MRRLYFIAGLCLIFPVLLFVVGGRGGGTPGPAFPTASGIVMAALLGLAVIASFVIFVIGLFLLSQQGRRKNGATLCILCGPSVIGVAILLVMGAQEGKPRSWQGQSFNLADWLMDYHEKAPEAFHYVSDGEEVSVAGFGNYLESIRRGHTFEMQNIRTRKGLVLDPWGNPVRFALDRNRDGYLEMAGQKFSTDGSNPPSLNYKIAVGVFLDPPKDWIGIGKAITRR